MGAGLGWICVGGIEKGRCAFIDIRECRPFPTEAADPTSSHASQPPSNNASGAAGSTEVDALLPLNLDPTARNFDDTPEVSERPRDDPPRPRARIHRRDIGREIVNAITVHQLPMVAVKGDHGRLRWEEIAVLANNDDTVHIFSLLRQRILTVLEFPTHMNYATLSPDATLLVAVGDEARTFFYRRKDTTGSRPPSEDDGSFVRYEWEPLADVRMTGADPTDPCFTIAFSPSGHVCAVGSQGGVITVYETARVVAGMEDDDAMIDVLHSSRPFNPNAMNAMNVPGAVRAMAFGPGPWDLLAWAEDRGRFCVTDLRDGFRSRQTVQIDPMSPDFERAELQDMTRYDVPEQSAAEAEAAFAQRYHELIRAGRDPLAEIHDAADYVEDAVSQRRRRHMDAAAPPPPPAPPAGSGRGGPARGGPRTTRMS